MNAPKRKNTTKNETQPISMKVVDQIIKFAAHIILFFKLCPLVHDMYISLIVQNKHLY